MAHKVVKQKPNFKRNHETISNKRSDSNWLIVRNIALSMVVGFVAIFLYYGFLETRINTPLSAPKAVVHSGLDVPSRYWGTYRPGVYFGTSVRHPLSPITGLIWFTKGHTEDGMLKFRHWCDQNDNLERFGWLAHNGRDFGSQEIKDKSIDIFTHFVKKEGGKHGGDWSARISVKPKIYNKKEEVNLFYYVALNVGDENGHLRLLSSKSGESLGGLEGYSAALGHFRLRFLPHGGSCKNSGFLSTRHLGFDNIKESLLKGLRLYENKETGEREIRSVGYDKLNDPNLKHDFIAFQINGNPPFDVDVVFESGSVLDRTVSLSGSKLSSEIEKRTDGFNQEFDSKFGLLKKGFNQTLNDFAKAALSNMIGGIGYFYGASKVQGVNNQDPVPYWKAALYTAVPSRSFFPRGFLWDEGFHNLLISKWDKEISMDIIAHWFDLMNWNGWIPREQILGVEARARVPEEFIVQHDKAANPPTLILTLHSVLSEFGGALSDENYEYLNNLWPRLKAWFNWYNTTQLGDLPGTYRWRGRNPDSKNELNPKTLTSGLDDYPRASHPSKIERHLDLRCWMALASSLMARLANLIEKDSKKYTESYKYLSDNILLDSLHWSYSANAYMDYGLHTDGVSLKKINPNLDKVRVVTSEPKPQYIDSFGYVSFFPLFLQIVDPNSPKLTKILEDLRKPELLWTKYGLRSLAKNSPYYNKWNTEHDPPYWRGSIWINMNYLAVRSLKYYSEQVGSNRELAEEIYKELRKNLINNVFKQYKETGYLWEHYNDKTGKGEGCKPFTGWSALVTLMMGETY